MDPNEQEADVELQEAEEVDETATLIRSQGDDQTAQKLEDAASELREDGEQRKIDTESQIHEANVKAGNQTSPG